MIVAISGSRSIRDHAAIANILDREIGELLIAGHAITLRLGDAIGVDHSALQWARLQAIPRRIYFADRRAYSTWRESALVFGNDDEWGSEIACCPSDWDDPRDGKRAGVIRNAAMIGQLSPEYLPLADLLIAIWDGESPGTRNCMASARNCRVPVRQYGGAGPIVYRTELPGDLSLVDYRGELPATTS